MDIITYALSKKIAAHAVSGVKSMSVSGQTLTINTKDSGVLTITFPTPKDGVSVTDIDVNANNQIVFTMSDGTEIISGKIPTVKGDKGDAGFSPTITENADNTDKIYKLDITTADSTFTTPNLKGADGQDGLGEENIIDSISVNGINITPDENKNVDITVPKVTNDLTDELKSSYDDAVTAKHTHDNKTVLDGITAEKVEAWDKAEENIQSDWNETDDTADGFIKNKPIIPDITGLATETYVDNKVADYTKTVDLADVAISGSYNDLADKPTIPSLDGYAKTSEIPSKVSELENDSNYLSSIPEEYVTETELEAKGYLTEHQDISGKVDKVEGKSLISDTEIARLATVDNYDDTDIRTELANKADITAIPTVDVTKSYVDTELAKKADTDHTHTTVNGHTVESDVPVDAKFTDTVYDDTDIRAEIAKKANTTAIPSKVSELTNDSNYQTAEQVNSTVTTEIAKVVADAPEDFDTLKEMSDWIAGHKDDASAMNSAISDNKTAITALQTGKADKSEIPTTVAELTDSADYAKTADVNNSISTLQNGKANTSDLTAHTGDSVIHVTAENKTLWNTVSNKVNKEDGKALLADTDKTNYDDAVTKAHTHENKEVLDGITSDKVSDWDNKSEFSGSYNDLNDKPTIDAELSNTSENAIQNKVVTKEINKLYSDISFNDFDTATDGISFTDAEDGNMLVTDWTKNLFNHTLDTTTKNGVTCTNNGDGTYTLDGTASINTYFIISGVIYDKNIINKYEGSKLVGAPSGSSYESFFLFAQFNGGQSTQKVYNDYGNGIKLNNIKGYETLEIIIYVKSGKTVSNLIFKPMLTTDLSATYDDFVPYGGYDIQSYGKNLLNVKKLSVNTISSTMTLTIENGSTFILNGTFDGSRIADIYCDKEDGTILLRANKKYIFSVDNIPDNVIIIFRKVGTYNGHASLARDKKVFSVVSKENLLLYFNINFVGATELNNFKMNVQIEEVPLEVTEPTAFEPYQGETITVTNEMESPVFGLKSHKGITHIISPGNVKCVYPTNESGKGVLDSLYNKDKMLTEQNKNLEVIGKCKNLLKTNISSGNIKGVSVVRNNDGTFTLNGNSGSEWGFLNLNYVDKTTKSVSEGKWRLVGTVKNAFLELMLNSSSCGMDDGNGLDFEVKSSDTNSWIRIYIPPNKSFTNDILKPMLVDATKTPYATYDDFVPYTGDGETLTHDVAELKNDLGGLTFSASGTTLTITDGTNTWTLGANS